jgi:large subunit ribosomal protein L21
MYAVIESGGKQHRVELGSEIQVDRLDVQPGDSIPLDRVLLVADGEDAAIGQPVVDGATVSAEVVAQARGRKVVVFKYKPKARTRVKKGFRAELTTLRITDIAFGGKSAAEDAEKARKAEAKKAREAQQAEQAAAAKAAEERAVADQALAAKLAADEADTKPAQEQRAATKDTPEPEARAVTDESATEAQAAKEDQATSDEPATEAQDEVEAVDDADSKKDE